MTEPLRERRRALLQELEQVDAALAATTPEGSPVDASWRRAAEAAPQYLALLDGTRRVRYVNRLQPGVRALDGRSIFEFLPAGQHTELRRIMDDAVASGLPQYFESEGSGTNGEPAWYSNWIVPVSGHEDVRLAVIAADVTHERQIVREHEDDRSLLESLVTHAPDSVLVVGRDHRIQFINRTRADRPLEDVVGQRAESFVTAEHRDQVHAAIEHVFETGRPTSYETRVEADEGEAWFSVRVGPVIQGDRVGRVSMVSTEITDRVIRERARREEQSQLAESERRFRTLVDHAPEALVIFDVDNGRFVDVNDNACRLFGLSRAQLLERGPGEVSPELQPDGSSSGVAAMSRIQDSVEGRPSVFEWTHCDASGTPIPCEVRLVRLPHKDRRWVRGSIIDISERKEAEAERERLTLELAQGQKLQALGQLTGGVAHDFNNLLTVIMGSMELIDIDSQTSERVRAHARQALAACERAAALTQRLLAFARRQPLRPQIVDMNALVTETEALLRRTLGGGIRIATRLAEGLWSCEADPAQLENVVLNLAINARDAMPDGGNLTIETANVTFDGTGAADDDDVAPGAYVHLSVHDDGCGMDDAVLRQVFEPFFTTKPAGRGSGLGLSMVYGFVKQSRGHVRIHSEPDSGTRVDVFLPRSRSVAAPAPRSAAASGVVPRGEDRLVLVVDDEAAVRALVLQSLGRLGYRTVEAADAAAALDHLGRNPDIALLLSDVSLGGGVSGPELARRAQALRLGLPVLFMSGYAQDAMRDGGKVPPDMVLLEKPFTHDQLGHAVGRALRGAGSPRAPGA
ncbi:MAG: PAS domain-containing protein [Pseudomonadales bacterium]